MFPQNGVLITEFSDVKKRAHEYGQGDCSATKCQGPLNNRASSKHSPADHHAALPPIELINRNQISNCQRKIECGKERSPRKSTEHQVHSDSCSKHKQLLEQRSTLQRRYVHLHVSADG